MSQHDDQTTTADVAGAKAEPDGGRATENMEDDSERRDPPHEDAGTDVAQGRSAAAGEDRPDAGPERSPLLPEEEAAQFQSRWGDVQTSFVDEPRRAVQEGDALVAELMQKLADSFGEERRSLETQWDRGDDVSTEDLRVALQRYRSFFDRLLSA